MNGAMGAPQGRLRASPAACFFAWTPLDSSVCRIARTSECQIVRPARWQVSQGLHPASCYNVVGKLGRREKHGCACPAAHHDSTSCESLPWATSKGERARVKGIALKTNRETKRTDLSRLPFRVRSKTFRMFQMKMYRRSMAVCGSSPIRGRYQPRKTGD